LKLAGLSLSDLWKTLNIEKLGHRIAIQIAVKEMCPHVDKWDTLKMRRDQDCEPNSVCSSEEFIRPRQLDRVTPMSDTSPIGDYEVEIKRGFTWKSRKVKN